MPPLDHPPILWLDDLYRGLLTEHGRIIFWGGILSALSLIASGSYLIAVSLGFTIAVILLSFIFGFLYRPPVSLQIRRQEIPIVVEGNEVYYRVEVSNQGSRAVKQVWIEERGLVPELRPNSKGVLVSQILPGQCCSIILGLKCLRRGIYSIDQLQVATALPLGFVKIGRRYNVESHIVVHPESDDCELDSLRQTTDPEVGVINQNRSTTRTSELLGVRPWRNGDQLRDVHWRATARYGKLVSKELAPIRTDSYCLILDLEAKTASDERGIDAMISRTVCFLKYVLPLNATVSLYWSHQKGFLSRQAFNEGELCQLIEDVVGLESIKRVKFDRWDDSCPMDPPADHMILMLTRIDAQRLDFVNKLKPYSKRITIWSNHRKQAEDQWGADEKIEVWK